MDDRESGNALDSVDNNWGKIKWRPSASRLTCKAKFRAVCSPVESISCDIP